MKTKHQPVDGVAGYEIFVDPGNLAAGVWLGFFQSPLGKIWAVADSTAVLSVVMPGPSGRDELQRRIFQCYGPVEFGDGGAVIGRFFRELEEYFSGRLQSFLIPFRPKGTRFQQAVWQEVSRIPYGSTRSYGWIASRIRTPGAARAVGQANRSNPTPLLVPCHRVTGTGGKIGGYSSGIEQKKWLLELESRGAASRSGQRPQANRKRQGTT